MITRDKLVNGAEYWYCRLFLGEQGAINPYFTTKPTKVIYKQYEEEEYKDLGEFVSDSGRVYLIVDIEISELFNNEQDCINYWNSLIKDAAENIDVQINDVTKKYYSKLNKLTNRKINILKELI